MISLSLSPKLRTDVDCWRNGGGITLGATQEATEEATGPL